MMMTEVEKALDRIIFRSEDISKPMTFFRVCLCISFWLLAFVAGMALASGTDSGLIILLFYISWSLAAFVLGKVCLARLEKI